MNERVYTRYNNRVFLINIKRYIFSTERLAQLDAPRTIYRRLEKRGICKMKHETVCINADKLLQDVADVLH